MREKKNVKKIRKKEIETEDKRERQGEGGKKGEREKKKKVRGKEKMRQKSERRIDCGKSIVMRKVSIRNIHDSIKSPVISFPKNPIYFFLR